AKIVKRLADQVFAQIGMDKDLEIALKLEEAALSDDYFVSRKLYPNVDFYTGLIYCSMAFPTDFFTVLFAVARTAGWLAQWEEMLNDKEQKIARPRQIYVGYGERAFTSQLTNQFPRAGKNAPMRKLQVQQILRRYAPEDDTQMSSSAQRRICCSYAF